MNNYLISNFLDFLSNKNDGYNPFDKKLNQKKKIKNFYPKSDLEDSDRDIRCPICLRLVWNPVHPKSCKHVFCKDCLNIWSETKLVCPICRAPFEQIIKVKKEDFYYGFQGELFVY